MRVFLPADSIVWFLAVLSVTCSAPEPSRVEKAGVSKTSTEKVRSASVPPRESLDEQALRIHRNAVVFDTHCDALMKVVDDGVDLGIRSEKGHIDLPRMAEGGLDVQVFAAWVGPDYWPNRAKERALAMIDALHATVAKYPDRIGFASTISDAEQIVGDGKIAVLLGIEGGYAIEDDLSALEMFYNKGVRHMTLTWMNNTNWADGSGDKPRWNGLNELGRKVVREMNRLGMVVDISHVSDNTFWDVLETTTKPVIASHSNIRAINDHHRNMSDKMLRALAKNGGVIGINFVAGFLDSDFNRRSEELRKKLEPRYKKLRAKYKDNPAQGRRARWDLYAREAAKLPPISIDKVIDHIDHAVKVAGIDHVGIGSDFDGFAVGPKELIDCTQFPLITKKLLERGYKEEEVTKILGKNFLRVFKEAIGK